MLNKLLYGIKIYKNVFSTGQKTRLFNDALDHLRILDDAYPGLQTKNNLHDLIRVPSIKYFTYERCWMNVTDIDYPDHEVWHTHPSKRVGVYYFSDCPGTIFEGKFGKFQLKGIANSLITFPGTLLHTAPVNKTGHRYTISFDILEEWSSGLWHWS